MLLQQVALPRLPAYARVTRAQLDQVLTRMATCEAELQQELDAGFRRMEMQQPALSELLALELSEMADRGAQGLTYFLAVTLFMGFESAFGKRLRPVTARDVQNLARCLVVDGELRSHGVCGDSYSEDLVAAAQPELCAFLREEIERPSSAERDSDVPYAALLLEVIALSLSVEPGDDLVRKNLVFL